MHLVLSAFKYSLFTINQSSIDDKLEFTSGDISVFGHFSTNDMQTKENICNRKKKSNFRFFRFNFSSYSYFW